MALIRELSTIMVGVVVEMFCDGKHFHTAPQICRKILQHPLECVKTVCAPAPPPNNCTVLS